MSDLILNTYIANKIADANKRLSMILRAHQWAPEKSELFAYKSLSLVTPRLFGTQQQQSIEALTVSKHWKWDQNQGTRLTTNIKERRSVTELKEKLGSMPIQKKRKKQQFNLLVRILSKEEVHFALCESYDELLNYLGKAYRQRPRLNEFHLPYSQVSMLTYHYSFLPRTVCILKEKCILPSWCPWLVVNCYGTADGFTYPYCSHTP